MPVHTIILTIVVAAVSAPSPAVATDTVPRCRGRKATIVGTHRGETIHGTRRRDVIVGRGGRDVIYGGLSEDIICGGRDNDALVDRQQQQPGGSVLRTQLLDGGRGNDTIVGAGGPYLLGGPGNDLIRQTDRFGQIRGGPGDDRMIVAHRNGDGWFRGGPGNDLIRSPKGRFDGGPGNDRMVATRGRGALYMPSLKANLTVDLSAQTVSGQGIDVLSGMVAAHTGSGDDSITGSEKNNELLSGAGNDVIHGLGGNDKLGSDEPWTPDAGTDQQFGGAGDDHLSSTLGDDLLEGGQGSDTATFDGGTALTVDLTADSATGLGSDQLSGIENVEFRNKGPIQIVGDEQPNVIIGDAQLPTQINGGAGDDVITVFGDAQDSIDGGSGNDSINADRCDWDHCIYLLMEGYFEPEVYADGNDTFIGGEGDDKIGPSLSGHDTLQGGDGVDTLIATAPMRADLRSQSGRFRDGAGAVGTSTLISFENAWGSDDRDVLLGTDSNDELRGYGGADRLEGRLGSDHLHGGGGKDRCLSGETLTSCEATA